MSDFLTAIFAKLFPKKTPQNAHLPIIEEVIVREDKYKKSYFDWMNSGYYKKLLQSIKNAYWKKRNDQIDDFQVHLLQMPYANGLAITYHKNVPEMHFQHFFDLLKDKVLNLGYQQANADRRMFDRPNYVETIEKYYLKPPITAQIVAQNELLNQKYGNILIEYILIDDQPSYIKLVASVYSDRLYTVALPFDQLLSHIFE